MFYKGDHFWIISVKVNSIYQDTPSTKQMLRFKHLCVRPTGQSATAQLADACNRQFSRPCIFGLFFITALRNVLHFQLICSLKTI